MTEKKDNRIRSGVVTSAVGIACNTALAAAKISVGALFGLVSVMADGFNNLSDCGSSIVSLVSFCISGKPADKEHPYGHKLAEYIAAMITGFLVLFLAVELLRSSVEKIISGETPTEALAAYIVLAVSVVIKAGMFVLYRIMAKRLSSEALRAAATDSLCDCIATSAVIAGIVILQFTGFAADGWIGILIALFIVWQGLKILAEASSKLLGSAPDAELTEKIKGIIKAGDGVLGMHDLRVYSYGKGVAFATVHIEMDAALPSLTSHTIIDGIEHKVKEETGVELTAHYDPVDLSDQQALELEKEIRAVVQNENSDLEMHDFRFIRGASNKVIFDLGVPYDCKRTDADLKKSIAEKVNALGYQCFITVDRE